MKRLSLLTVILPLVLLTFFCKGVFLAVLQPIFTGQDEARHYNSIQLITESHQESQRPATPPSEEQNKDDLSTYRFSEEIRETARATDNHLLRSDIFNTLQFSESSTGLHEPEIASHTWSIVNDTSSKLGPDAVQSTILYHQLASGIEQLFGAESILVRFYAIRILSVLLGTLAVYLAYLTARTVGFSSTISLILTTILAFHPKFSIYLSQINYDALLIPLFFLFTYLGTHIVRHGLTPVRTVLLIGAIIAALLTKATGALLILMSLPLFIPLMWRKIQAIDRESLRRSLTGIITLGILLTITLLYVTFFRGEVSLIQKFATLPTYLSKTVSLEALFWPSGTYWGTIDWTRSWFMLTIQPLLFLLQLTALIGLSLLFFSKKLKSSWPDFLPSKNQVVFLLSIVTILHAGVRFADWNAFVRVGGAAMSLGTPGRYFLPALLAHLLLIGTGLGAFLAYFKRAAWFTPLLCLMLVFMMSFMLYTIFGILIPRYYF